MPFKRSQLQEAVEAAIQASHPSQAGVSAWDRPWEMPMKNWENHGKIHYKWRLQWEDHGNMVGKGRKIWDKNLYHGGF